MRYVALTVAIIAALIGFVVSARAAQTPQPKDVVIGQTVGYFVFYLEDAAGNDFGYKSMIDARAAARDVLMVDAIKGVEKKLVIISAVPLEIVEK